MATPAYYGPGQPLLLSTSGGSLGRLGSIFGAATPAYSGDGQPSSGVGALGGASPAYLPATNTPSKTNQDDLACAIAQSSCPIDHAAIAAGQIAIVVPRSACGDREEPAATD